MTNKNAVKRAPIRLQWSEKDRSVLFITNDKDLFALTVEEVILACQAYDREDRAKIHSNFSLLLNELGAWVNKHRPRIRKGILTKRDNGLFFLVIMSDSHYDDKLETELAKLDIRVARNKNLSFFQLSVLALPDCEQSEYESFVDPSLCLVYQQSNA